MITYDRRSARTRNTTIIVALWCRNRPVSAQKPIHEGRLRSACRDSRTGCSGAHADSADGRMELAARKNEPWGCLLQKPRPRDRAGRCRWGGSVAVALAGARPDEGEALAVLVVEEVGEDRRVKRRIVELEREIIAALVGALRPSGPDLGPAHIDPVAGSVVVGAVGLGHDAHAFGLEAEGDDLALEIAVDLLERTDVSHVTSPCCFRARDHCGLDGDRRAGDDRRRTRSRAGAQRRMTAVRLSCLARNGL